MRIGQFDPIAETSEFPDHSCRPVLLGLFANRWAPFFVTNSLVQNLPDQAAKTMGNHSDRLIVSQARHISAIEDGEEASFVNRHAPDQTGVRPRLLHCEFDLAAPGRYYLNLERFS